MTISPSAFLLHHGRFQLLIFGLALWGSPMWLSGQGVQINEFLASNVHDFPEMYDFGDYNDWIELYNTTGLEQSLEGYFLSDDPNDPLKWRFPSSAILAPNDHLLIWADGYNEVPGVQYTRETWPYEDYITRHYHTNFRLSKSGEAILLSQAGIASQTTLVPQESNWRFLDDGSTLPADWTEVGFEDSNWGEGPAELGYGDGDENTVLNYGPSSDDKFITTYFRKTFIQSASAPFDQLIILLKRDDGAVVYLNGQEIIRSNLPEGDITSETPANTAVSSAEESAFYEFGINADDLVFGENCLAVEVHQISPTSSDISFDLELTAVRFDTPSIVDQISYGQQFTDVSFGRAVGETTWSFFGEPTPGSANLTPATISTEGTAEVTSSIPSGFYEGSLSLDLSTASTTASIYYTLDGSRPQSSGTLYTNPLTINTTTVVKARAFEAEHLPGPIMTESYLVDEPQNISTISLIAEPPTLWDPDIGIYENEYKQREIPVTIHYYDTDPSENFRIDAGSRLGGMNIWTKPQKPFTIYTRGRFGDDVIRSHIFKSKPITDFSRIVFRNGGDDWEETLLRDPMTGSLVRGMMECGYMAFQPSALFLNGQYWGIYNIREKFNTRYFFENFGVDPDQIDHLEYGATSSGTRLMTIAGDRTAYDQLIQFILTSNLNDANVFRELDERMNIDSFIDHVSMTLFCANTSWGHNREWWRPRDSDGRWQWLIVDVDRGFNPSNINTNLLDNLLRDYLLFQYLMASERFQEHFLQRAAAHFNHTFAPERVGGIIDSLSNLIQAEIPRHIERWGSEGSVVSISAWEAELAAIHNFAQNRSANLFTHFNNELSLAGTVEINTATYPSEGGYISIEGVPQISESETGPYFKGIPLHLTAVPAPGWEVIGWNGLSDSAQIVYDCANDSSFLALFQPSNGSILPGQLTANTTLLAHQTYYIAEDLHVPPGVSLTVEAGVEIRMPEGGHLIIEGNLIVDGTAADPVKIRANPLTGNQPWGGISFSNAVDTSRIDHLELTGATRGVDPMIHRGAISGFNAHLIIDHLNIQNVQFPIYVEGGSIQLLNSTLRCDHISDFINVKRGEALIQGCHFYGSEAPDTDAIDLDGVQAGIVSNNRIYNFAGPNSDGVDIGEESSDILIRGNLIYHASDKGISVGQSSSVLIEENLIVGCVEGVAIKDNSTALLANNTYVNNHVSLACYEKNSGRGGGSATEMNSIYANNLVSAISLDSYSQIEVGYSLSNTEALSGIGNLTGDPLFIDGAQYNFEISQDSPCIDAGDPDAPPDTDGSPRDMGAYYTYDAEHYPFPIPGHFTSYLTLNELLASNSTSLSDEAGEFDDWLEIYNPTGADLNLSTLYLTDNPNILDKWQFPQEGAIIPAEGYLLIWCDEDVNQGPLHANFKLSNSGEFLALVDSNGLSIIDSLTFGPQTSDISYGRLPDGGENWSILTPTPGTSNQLVHIFKDHQIPGDFRLHQNFPNPFNPRTTIRYDLPEQVWVHLNIFDIRGRLIRTLVDASQSPGYKQITWDGIKNDGSIATTGIYVYSLDTESFRETQKLVLLK